MDDYLSLTGTSDWAAGAYTAAPTVPEYMTASSGSFSADTTPIYTDTQMPSTVQPGAVNWTDVLNKGISAVVDYHRADLQVSNARPVVQAPNRIANTGGYLADDRTMKALLIGAVIVFLVLKH